MQQWEYICIYFTSGPIRKTDNDKIAGILVPRYSTFEMVINGLGSEGWELIAAENQTYTFKRPKEWSHAAVGV